MRIKVQQFLFGKLHSWSSVGQNLGRSLLKMGHSVDFVSTDGMDKKFIPQDLKPHIKERPIGNYDCQISYTAPHNWHSFLKHGTKNKFGIWNYEYNNKRFDSHNKALLEGFAKHYHATSLVLPSSNFTKDVFVSMGIPKDKMQVIPHGINLDDFKSKNPWPIRSKKTVKILLNIAQPHRRKALHLAFKAFGEAFTKKDDVVLVAKVFKSNKTEHQFNIDFNDLYRSFEKQYPNHAQVELIHDYIPNIADIYSACDINFSATFAECWHLPSLEALACGLVNVVPRYGGILDFCDDQNSLLIDGDVVRAPREHQYWQFNPFAVHFEIDIADAVKKLQFAVQNCKELKCSFSEHSKDTVNKFTWDEAAIKLINLCT